MPRRVLGLFFSLLLVALPTFAADRNVQVVGILHLGGEQIEVLSWSWGMTQTASSTGGGGGAGKVQMQDLHFTKPVDKASMMLFDACVKGQHFPEATLTVRKAGGGQQEYMTFKMSDVLVSSYQTGGSTSDIVNESISFNFTRMDLMVPRGR